MKRLLYTLLLFSFAACDKDNEPAEDIGKLSLEKLKVLPSNIPMGNYTDLTFSSSITGFALSSKFVAKTTDGGSTWDSIPLPFESSWTKIIFPDPLNGYIIGGDNNAGFLLKSTDAGETWTTINLPIRERPYGAYFLTKDIGFITGTLFFSKTTDGGQTWTPARQAQGSIYHDVEFRNALEGYATSIFGAYFKTVDGGNTWDSLNYDNKYFSQVHFAGSRVLLAKSYDTLVDINNSFSIITKPGNAEKLLFLDEEHCISVGGHKLTRGYLTAGDVFVTNDGWKTYKQKTFEEYYKSISTLARMGQNKAMMLGFDVNGPQVLVLEW